LIDLHGGDLDENLRPYSYWAKTGNERQDAASRAMVLAFGSFLFDGVRGALDQGGRRLYNRGPCLVGECACS
jgi:hypothetical protein